VTERLLESGINEAKAFLAAKYDAGFPPFFEGTHGTLPAPPAVSTACRDHERHMGVPRCSAYAGGLTSAPIKAWNKKLLDHFICAGKQGPIEGLPSQPLRGNVQIATDTFGQVSEFHGAAELIGD